MTAIAASPLRILDLPVEGMTCSSCAGRVEKALKALPQVRAASVNLASERAHVEFDGAARPLLEAIGQAGYRVPEDSVALEVEGMSCASCVGRVEAALNRVPGVVKANVNLAAERAEVTVARGAADIETLISAVKTAGYAAKPVADRQSAEQTPGQTAGPDNRQMKALRRERGLALLAIALSLPLLGGMVAEVAGFHDRMMPPWSQFAIASFVQVFLGWRFYNAAWGALRAGTGNMDLLVALGTSAAWGLSTWNWFAAAPNVMPHLYYEASVAIIAFVRLGKWLELRARAQTLDALRSLIALKPATARLLHADGREEDIASARLRPGDLIVVRAGEAIAADGEIADGHASITEAMLTGESLPVDKAAGDVVHAGTINENGRIVVRVTATGGEMLLSRIVRLVETAQASKPPVQKLVDHISSVFVPVVVFVALVTFTLTLSLSGNVETALLHAIAVLVIACPCALGLATPAALMVGTGVAARHGILVRDAEALELARNLKAVAFDKTGTLTIGRPAVSDVVALNGDDEALVAIAASLQAGSQHPLAEALRDRAGEIPPAAAQDFREWPGMGVGAELQGRRFVLGNARLMREHGIDTALMQPRADALAAMGRTVSWLAETVPVPALRGLVAFRDEAKPSAAAAIARLNAMGIETMMLSGDSRGAAESVAAELGIHRVEAGILPQDKAAHILALRKRTGGPVAMVGDGINDAPALAAADVGIAMSTGTDVAMQTAGITLLRGDPALVADAIALARVTHAKIRQNLFWAFVYNVVGIPLAAFGLLNPMLAGAAMALSSVSVLANALLLKRWRANAGEAR